MTSNPYFKGTIILAVLSLLLVLASIVLMVLQAPIYHTLMKLTVMALLQIVILVLAQKRRVAALVIAFLLSLYGLIYAYHVGIIYDIFNFTASLFSYINFLLMVLMLIVSGLGLFVYFRK